MTEKRYKVKWGQEVQLHLPPGSSAEVVATDKKDERKYFVGVDYEDDLYQFFAKGIQIYDLGMKLNGNGEYSEISETLLLIGPDIPDQIDVWALELRSQFLAGDPTGETDGKSHRKIIPFAAQNWYLDAAQTPVSEEEVETTTILLGENESRPSLDQTWGVEDPEMASNKGWKLKGESGVLTIKNVADSLFQIKAWAYFIAFGTAGSIITDEPDPEAPNLAPLSLTVKLEKILLAPSLCVMQLAGQFDSGGGPTGVARNALIRLSPYAEYTFNPPLASVPDVPTRAALTQLAINNGVYASFISIHGPQVYTNGHLFIIPLGEGNFGTEANRLQALLKTKTKTYYVWKDSPLYSLFPEGIFSGEFEHGMIEGDGT